MAILKQTAASALGLFFSCGLFNMTVEAEALEYRVLATTKTSTMQKELNEAGAEGFRFEGVMGGNTSWGGSEAVVVMSRDRSLEKKAGFGYKLLATTKTSSMQKELVEAAEAGFQFVGMTVAETAFGGKELVTIVRRKERQ